jgi:phosphatidylglycerol:prolipoprotein diacylglycerol transferase
LHPDFIRLGPLDIHTYGVLVAIGFMVGLAVAAWRARREKVDPDRITDMGAWLIVSGMLGGKLFHIIFFWNDFITAWHEQGVRSLREGFVFYGGFIVATLTAAAYTTVKKLPFFRVADIFAPSLALGHAFGRLGCFFNGCCYGKVCASDFPLGVRFPRILDATGRLIGSMPFIDHLQRGLVNISATRSLAVHPTELYEVFGNLAIFAGLSAVYRHKRADGQILWLYVLSYGVLRFIVEFFRGDYETYFFGIFTLGHLMAMVMIVVASIALFRLRHQTDLREETAEIPRQARDDKKAASGERKA